ncbi:MAG: TRAP transporter small permease subunit, partial [Acidobacteria bacterium]|nr:TRAP transporter small permease subunit [Acidobacteriota bacterium]NIM63768.1 TRAP transporter small permease subunit [Acidobacteriota bacterium]NIO59337.1 TRAP transporter small permease subunit [Acidobacteriota bacterium]NIQ30351.1 TRAP transporter small permease subunit [Acidobacteriota bacterium]NIQ85288.1 TRAP transporter small permease subunit [Acidobacteriota bacterium]
MAARLADAIDRLADGAGALIRWLVLVMVVLGAFNAVARYLGRSIGVQLSSNAFIELQWYLFSLIFLLGAGYTLKRRGHVRVDVIYEKLAPRTRAWIDLAGSVFLLLPFCVFGVVMTWPSVRNSWSLREGSPDPGGLPRYPIKTVILIAFGLLFLQGVAWILRRAGQIRSGRFE